MITCILYEQTTFVKACKFVCVPPVDAVVACLIDDEPKLFKVYGVSFDEDYPTVKLFVKCEN